MCKIFKARFIVFIVGIILIVSCGRQISCPEFDSQIVDWVPYQPNDTIRLVNSSNDSVLFLTISEVNIEHTTHYRTDADCGKCNDYINVSGDDVWISIVLDENAIKTQTFSINGVSFADYNSDITEQTDYSFAGMNYGSVLIFKKKDTSEYFNTLVIAKGTGIVGLADKFGNIWLLHSLLLKTDEQQSVEIVNVSC